MKQKWYTLKIYYQTGDTFSTTDTTNIIGCCWKNKELAEQAIKEIRKHNEIFTSYKSDKVKKKKASKYPWFNNKNAEYSLLLEMDNKSRKIINAFWVGYFEYLQYVEIILCKD